MRLAWYMHYDLQVLGCMPCERLMPWAAYIDSKGNCLLICRVCSNNIAGNLRMVHFMPWSEASRALFRTAICLDMLSRFEKGEWL